MKTIDEIAPIVLTEMLKTFERNNAKYKDNSIIVGRVLAAFFPDGITLKTEQDFRRYHMIDWIVGKLTRYTQTEMGHEDSIFDAAVYCALLAALTRIYNNEHKIEGEH